MTSLQSLPDARGHFGRFGGIFVPETLMTPLRELATEHGLAELSMGTSQDYRVAVEEGATYIRVGSSLFGNRRPQ